MTLRKVPRLIVRSDSNQSAVVKTLRAIGLTVINTHQLGGEFLDLLVCCPHGQQILVEVKFDQVFLTDDEREFHAAWPAPIIVDPGLGTRGIVAIEDTRPLCVKAGLSWRWLISDLVGWYRVCQDIAAGPDRLCDKCAKALMVEMNS